MQTKSPKYEKAQQKSYKQRRLQNLKVLKCGYKRFAEKSTNSVELYQKQNTI